MWQIGILLCALVARGAAVPGVERAQEGGAAALRGASSFAQLSAGVGWTDEHGFCELCMTTIQQLQYGSLPSCGGSAKASSFSACSQVSQSVLSYAHEVLHLLAYGCHQYNPYRGWQTVRPCPAHAICGRVVNTFDLDKKPHCPADYNFRFPEAMAGHYPQVKNPLLKYALKQLQETPQQAPAPDRALDIGSAPAQTPPTAPSSSQPVSAPTQAPTLSSGALSPQDGNAVARDL